MDFLELAKKRKSVYEYSDRKISEKNIKKILEAGRWAPSFGNLQPWKFLVVKKKNKIEELMKSAFYGAFHTSPKILIVAILQGKECGGEHRAVLNNKVGEIEGNLSIAMATMNMILEATDLGIGSAIITPKEEIIRKALKLEKKDFVPMIICLGYEKKGAFQKKRKRKEFKEIVLYEKD